MKFVFFWTPYKFAVHYTEGNTTMCLAIPMQIVQIEGFDARCSAKGIERTVSLFMLQDEPVDVGDWVLVHVGYAIQTISPEDARQAWELFELMAEDDVSA